VKPGVVVVIVFGLAVLAVLIYSSMGLRSHRVEVCVEFNGRKSCRTVSGSTRELALRTGVENACATIASGVTDSIACGNTPPTSVRWLEGK
jgi:hypothetical protein